MLEEDEVKILFDWVKYNDYSNLCRWVQRNPPLINAFMNCADNGGWNPLHHAAFRGHDKIIACFLDLGADMECKDLVGQTSLIIATSRGAVRAIRKLIEYGADLEAVNNDDQTSLFEAIEHGNLKVVTELVQFGANPNNVDRFNFNTVMWCAWHNMECIQEILDVGADIECANKDGWTALFYACQHKSVQMMRLLLERGADYLRLDTRGQYVMQLAHGMDFEIKRAMEEHIVRTDSILSETYDSSLSSSKEFSGPSDYQAPAVLLPETLLPVIVKKIPIPIMSGSSTTQAFVDSIVESVSNATERLKLELKEQEGYDDDIEDNETFYEDEESLDGEDQDDFINFS